MLDTHLAMSLAAVVLILAALASGFVERAPISFPILFLLLGAALGPRGFGILAVDLHSPILEAVGVLTLAFVLFLDAVKLRFDGGWRAWTAPVLALGPGTLISIAAITGLAMVLFSLPPLLALTVGAVLASTDPVVLRDVLRNERIPRSVRRVLSVEAGMNDLVVLPVILVVIALLQGQLGNVGDWLSYIGRVFLVAPASGFVIGGVGAWAMGEVDRRHGIRLEYQALYGVGLVLAAFLTGDFLGGDGFLAAFFGGLAVAVLNVRLCDCFMEYGEVTAEMFMLLSFVLFGALLSVMLGPELLLPGAALAVMSLAVVRPVSMGLVLLGARMSNSARLFIGWFGPRGLNSLLLVLLVIQAVPGNDHLMAIVGVVVCLSVIAHGVSATPLAAWYGRRAAAEVLPEERDGTAEGLFDQHADTVPRVSAAALADRLAGPNPPVVLDVRSRAAYDADPSRIAGDVRVQPDRIEEWAAAQETPRAVVAYCT